MLLCKSNQDKCSCSVLAGQNALALHKFLQLKNSCPGYEGMLNIVATCPPRRIALLYQIPFWYFSFLLDAAISVATVQIMLQNSKPEQKYQTQKQEDYISSAQFFNQHFTSFINQVKHFVISSLRAIPWIGYIPVFSRMNRI